LHRFVANLLRKLGLCTKFHQNRPSFIEDITTNNLLSFFSENTVARIRTAANAPFYVLASNRKFSVYSWIGLHSKPRTLLQNRCNICRHYFYSLVPAKNQAIL